MHEIKFSDVEDFAKNGKVILGPSLSKCNRPILLLRTRMEDKVNAWEMNIKHFAYQMEMTARWGTHGLCPIIPCTMPTCKRVRELWSGSPMLYF